MSVVLFIIDKLIFVGEQNAWVSAWGSGCRKNGVRQAANVCAEAFGLTESNNAVNGIGNHSPLGITEGQISFVPSAGVA